MLCVFGFDLIDSMLLLLMSVWRFETCDIILAIPNINRYFWIPVHVGLGFVTEIRIFCKNCLGKQH